jgi:hypothetical protein
MRCVADDVVPGKFTLRIEGEVIAAFDHAEEIDDAPEAQAARRDNRQILVYGPAGELV